MSIEQEATPSEAATAKEENPMKTKSKTTKATSKKQAAPAKKETKPKADRKKREPKEKVELRTLALRVTNQEFDLVHKAAGPRNLSQFMKSTVLAAATKHLSK